MKRLFIENVVFHADLRFPIENCQNRPQDGAKIGPRSLQDGLKTGLKCDRFFKRFFDRFLVVLGSVLAPFWRPRWVQKPTQVRQGFLGRPPLERQLAPGQRQDPQEHPKRPKTTLKTTKNDPRTPSRRPKISLLHMAYLSCVSLLHIFIAYLC